MHVFDDKENVATNMKIENAKTETEAVECCRILK